MDFFSNLIDCDDLLDFIRNDVILKKDVYYFDWMASGLESRVIQNRLNKILPLYANTHSHTSSNADFISSLYLESKEKLKEYLGLSEDFFVIPSGFGASGAIKKYQEIKGIYIPPVLKNKLNLSSIKLPIVIIGPYEHHSNEISLREGVCKCIRIPLKGDLIDLENLDSVLEMYKNNEILASINIASNVSGIILPYEIISKKLRDSNVNIAFDCAAISPHKNIDSNLFDAAFLSPHKILGGIGSCGILCIRKNNLDISLPPTFSGGGSIKYASSKSHYYIDDIESREDSGTPPILGFLKATLAYKYRNEIGLDFIHKREKVLYNILLYELKNIDGIMIYGIDNNAEHIPVLSFNVDSISPYDLAYELSYKYHIETRAGCSCAGSYGHNLLHKEEVKNIDILSSNPSLKPAWLRVSLHYSHNVNDIEYFVDSLKKSIKRLR
ncbi:hypothetical protein CCY99_06785 [Helicobacter sp. 16-1353]|uniref:aminotransferase class V-fold PLP-dependent enzyme n=1 Tax=Helicobacter sp. 16-1353 TaxID=2004996 RepID=UPI000DCD4DA9|nr:aminotransferase class V-fold PLP-dependent enzyme [Helicobacter sp. 16-1353]RAX53066.1 hypothetical protein CCY99_06785 [Helicobacter sp. 16-1353]